MTPIYCEHCGAELKTDWQGRNWTKVNGSYVAGSYMMIATCFTPGCPNNSTFVVQGVTK